MPMVVSMSWSTTSAALGFSPTTEYTERVHLLDPVSDLWCCLAVLPIMMEQGSGIIVNLGSQSPRGLTACRMLGKGGIFALTKVLAMEYGRYGIRVNTVAPGGTEVPDRITPRLAISPGVMAEALDTEETRAYREEMGQDIRNQQAIKRREAEEQAATIAFLASDDASFITGQVINCSGGQS